MLRVVITSILVIAAGCDSKDQAARDRSAANKLSEYWQNEFAHMDVVADMAVQALQQADSIELIFLVPDENYSPPEHVEGKEYFHWWIITGRIVVDENDRRKLAANLIADVETHRHQPYADCFEPRHALRVHTGRENYVDIILCFKCQQLWCFDEKGHRIKTAAGISDQLRSFLNSLNPENVEHSEIMPAR